MESGVREIPYRDTLKIDDLATDGLSGVVDSLQIG